MTVKRFIRLSLVWSRWGRMKLRFFLNRRTRREKLWILVGVLVLFAALDIWQLYRGCTTKFETGHIEPLKSKNYVGR